MIHPNPVRSPELLEAMRAVSDEVQRAQSIYGAFASAHEGYAVLLEEMDELKDEVWKSPSKRDYGAMAREACQVAAMAVRLMIEIAGPQVVDEYRHLPKTDRILEQPQPTIGALDVCKMCGEGIRFVDPGAPLWDMNGNPYGADERGVWDHHLMENKPKHPAVPTRYALYDYNPTL